MLNLKKIALIALIALSFSSLPIVTVAEGLKPNTINDIFYSFTLGNMTGYATALIAVALVTFLSGVVKFVGAGDNEEKRSEGRMVMIYGLIVLFVMMALWGLVSLVFNTFFDGEIKSPDYLPPLL